MVRRTTKKINKTPTQAHRDSRTLNDLTNNNDDGDNNNNIVTVTVIKFSFLFFFQLTSVWFGSDIRFSSINSLSFALNSAKEFFRFHGIGMFNKATTKKNRPFGRCAKFEEEKKKWICECWNFDLEFYSIDYFAYANRGGFFFNGHWERQLLENKSWLFNWNEQAMEKKNERWWLWFHTGFKCIYYLLSFYLKHKIRFEYQREWRVKWAHRQQQKKMHVMNQSATGYQVE